MSIQNAQVIQYPNWKQYRWQVAIDASRETPIAFAISTRDVGQPTTDYYHAVFIAPYFTTHEQRGIKLGYRLCVTKHGCQLFETEEPFTRIEERIDFVERVGIVDESRSVLRNKSSTESATLKADYLRGGLGAIIESFRGQLISPNDFYLYDGADIYTPQVKSQRVTELIKVGLIDELNVVKERTTLTLEALLRELESEDEFVESVAHQRSAGASLWHDFVNDFGPDLRAFRNIVVVGSVSLATIVTLVIGGTSLYNKIYDKIFFTGFSQGVKTERCYNLGICSQVSAPISDAAISMMNARKEALFGEPILFGDYYVSEEEAQRLKRLGQMTSQEFAKHSKENGNM